jgi:ABC-type nitrate/sulfonate/bicarbonate transport system permease component
VSLDIRLLGPRLLATLKGLAPLVVGLGLWQLLAVPTSSVLPPPTAWWHAVVLLAKNGSLAPAFLTTLLTLSSSLVVASAAGLMLGILLGTTPAFRQWASWSLECFRAIPPPVVIPIVVLVLGYTATMKVVVVGFATFWPVLLNTISGALQIRPLMYDVARCFRLSRTETLLKIVIPATAPSFLLGVRVALPHAVIITLVVEMFTGAVGLGGLMISAERNFNSSGVFGLLVFVGVLGLGINAAFNAAERVVVRRRT